VGHRSPGRPVGAGTRRARARDPVPGRGRGGRGGGLLHRLPPPALVARAAAPILATYMARRPPAFVRNLAGARHVNIAHGLYPREPLPPAALDGLAAYLRRSVTRGQGRTYAGGLTKFEPGEMERLPVPVPALLPAYAPPAAALESAAAPGSAPALESVPALGTAAGRC